MKNKKILGLDLGVASLGWAVSAYDEKNKKWYIDDFGVRLWDSPEDSKSLDSLTKKRREFRSQRRLIRRKQQRINDAKNIFINSNILTKNEIEEHLIKLTTKGNGYSSEDDNLNPLILREKGLTKKLTNLQLFIVIYNFAKRRGYENMFSLEKEDREALSNTEKLISKYKFPIKAIMSDELRVNGVSSYRNKQNKEGVNNTNYLFTRSNYKDELEEILKKQVSLKVIDENISSNLFEVIFRQRFFEDSTLPKEWHGWDEEQKEAYRTKIKNRGQNFYSSWHDTIGKCTYYPDEKRVSKSSVFSDLFIIYNELSKVSENLSNESRTKLYKIVIEKYLKEYDFSAKIVKEAFEQIDEDFVNKEKGVSYAKANFFLVKLSKLNKKWLDTQLKIIDGNFENIKDSKIETLGNIIGNVITPQKIINELKENVPEMLEGLSEEELLEKIKKTKFTSGRNNVSSKYVFDLTKSLLTNGVSIQDFGYEFLKNKSEEYINKEVGKANSKNLDVSEALKYAFKPNINDSDMVRNAVVFRSINQTRLVLRALLKEYKNFDSVNFEVARDLYASLTERNEVRSSQDKNEKRNIFIRDELEKMNLPSTNKDLEKYKLWEQQKMNPSDLYAIDVLDITSTNTSKEGISLEDAILGDYEVDHIIPYSIRNDNTIWNKIITSRKHNQSKGKRTPIDYFEHSKYSKKEIESWKSNIKKLPIFKGKNLQKESVQRKLNNLFLPFASRDGEDSLFESKDLNDIRYISKYMNLYLNNQFEIYSKITSFEKPKIHSVKGRVTSMLRREWLRIDSNGTPNPWGMDKKVREITPYHHSVDAIIVSQFESFPQLEFSTFFINLKAHWRYLRNKIYKDGMDVKEAKESLKEFMKFPNKIDKNNKKINYVNPYLIERLNSFCDYLLKNLTSKKESSKDFNTYIRPLVETLSDDVLNLIPIKLLPVKETIEIKYNDKESGVAKVFEKEIRVPKFDREVHPKEWSEINNRDEKSFPWPSYKINKRIRGEVFGSELPVSKKDAYDKDGNFLSDKFYIDKKGTIWNTSKYLGLDISSKEKGYEFIKKIDCKNKKYNNVLSRNVAFQLNGNILIYKGKSGETQIVTPPLVLSYFGSSKFKEIFSSFPLKGKNSLTKSEDFRIVDISFLGKLK